MSVSVSIVSHGQGALADRLVADLVRCPAVLEVLLTLNIPETRTAPSARFPVHVIENPAPRGFGANHNAAFARARGDYFCVLNPDLRIAADPFPELVRCLADERLGVCAPRVLAPDGGIEDSARAFPTPRAILAKALGRRELPGERAFPDWVAGMFMLFRAEVFRRIGGFDARYYLYYEDVELCGRIRLAGYEVAQRTSVSVVHDARRQSRRDARYFVWHLASMLRWFRSTTLRALRKQRAQRRGGSDGARHGDR